MKRLIDRIGDQVTLLISCVALLAVSQPPTAMAAKVPQSLSDVRGFNYTPASANRANDFWLHLDSAEVDRDFGYANELGLNQTRVFLRFDSWDQDAKTLAANLVRFMDIASKHRIGVMLVLGPSMRQPEDTPEMDARLQDWIKAVAGVVQDKPSMAFWDLQNEPDWTGSPDRPRSPEQMARARHYVKRFAETVHEVDQVHPTTVGCTFEKCMEETAEYADVLSFHDYSPTVAEIDANLAKASAFAAKVGKPFFNTEMACIGRANPYDIMLHEYTKAHVGFYIFELMITQYWGGVHGVFYPDGTVRDPSIPAAILGFFRSHAADVRLEDPDRESWVTTAVDDGKAWLASPKPDWNQGLRIAEIEANLLEGAQLVPMRTLPTRTVDLLRASPPDMTALRSAIQQNVALLEPYIDQHPASKHW